MALPKRKLSGAPNEDVTIRLLSRFRELLADGSLCAGDRLPPERELARQLGVSRNSLRQALKVLEVIGVLTQKTGAGTHLRTDASSILGEPMRFLVLLDSISHFELFEARLIVEPELAARAAERATSEHLRLLRGAIDAMAASGGESEKVAEADLAFHNGIFHAAGNRVCQSMFTVIHRSLLSSIAETSRFVDVEHTLRFHEAIYDAIHGRDAARARRMMTEHVMDAREVFRRAAAPPPQPIASDVFTPITRRRRAPGSGAKP